MPPTPTPARLCERRHMVGIDIDSQRRVFAGRRPVGGDRLPLGVEGDGYGLYLP